MMANKATKKKMNVLLTETRLRAVVIKTSEAEKEGRCRDMREINNILTSVAKKREGVDCDIPLIDYWYSAKLHVHVGIYEAKKRDARMTFP